MASFSFSPNAFGNLNSKDIVDNARTPILSSVREDLSSSVRENLSNNFNDPSNFERNLGDLNPSGNHFNGLNDGSFKHKDENNDKVDYERWEEYDELDHNYKNTSPHNDEDDDDDDDDEGENGEKVKTENKKKNAAPTTKVGMLLIAIVCSSFFLL